MGSLQSVLAAAQSDALPDAPSTVARASLYGAERTDTPANSPQSDGKTGENMRRSINEEQKMSWFNGKRNSLNARDQASVSEILACFRDERDLLFRLALLITGDKATAEQSVVNACDMTVQGRSPFRDWLTEWAKSSTIMSAISKTVGAIRSCEPAYKDLDCLHSEHRVQRYDAGHMSFFFGIDPSIIIAELDPLARSVLVLRTAIGASIQDCALRLNVSRRTVLAANCRAMTWLRDIQLRHHLECG
jgi:hypothetical protein